MPSSQPPPTPDSATGLIANDYLRASFSEMSPSPRRSSFTSSASSGGWRETRSAIWTWGVVLLPVFVHVGMSVGLFLAMQLYVNEGIFNIHHRKPKYVDSAGQTITLPFNLLQPDITTLLSVILAFIRFAGAFYFAGTAWRCAFILLEKHHMRLTDFDAMVNQSIRSYRRPVGDWKKLPLHITVTMILLLALPSQYAAPLLTGSITWVPDLSMVTAKTPLRGVSTSIFGPGKNSWEWYCTFRDNRANSRLRAAAVAALSWSASDSLNDTRGLLKRVVPAARNLSTNSTLSNVTLPFFASHSFAWITSSQLKAMAQSNNSILTYLYPSDRRLGVSSDDNPLGRLAPTLAFLFPDAYDPIYNETSEKWDWPEKSRFIGQTASMALFSHRIDEGTECDITPSDVFGTLPSDVGFGRLEMVMKGGPRDGTTLTNCYIFANVTYSAGVVPCNECVVAASGGVLQSSVESLAPSFDRPSASEWLHEVEGDAMVDQALRMTPEVIASMALMNISIPSTWNNLEGYASEMLARSYSASWTVLTDVVGSSYDAPWSEVPSEPQTSGSGPGVGLSTAVQVALPATRASVSRWRANTWLIGQLLLSLSCFMFTILQLSAKKPVVRSPITEVMLFDTKELRIQAGLERVGHHTRKDSSDTQSLTSSDGYFEHEPLISPTHRARNGKEIGFIRLTPSDGSTVVHCSKR